MEVEQLLACVQVAEGPNREMDFRIWYLCYPETEVLLYAGDVRARTPGRWGKLRQVPTEGWTEYEGIADHVSAAQVSRSLDAALELCESVLPDWRPSIARERQGDWSVFMINDADLADLRTVRESAKTAPLALLAAILRALSDDL